MKFSPFRIDVPHAVLDDLRSRLRRSRFTVGSGDRPWRGGTDPDYLRDLVTYWANGFDWHEQETALNALPHYRAVIAGGPCTSCTSPPSAQPGRPRRCR